MRVPPMRASELAHNLLRRLAVQPTAPDCLSLT
jgi:hypothetical protein